MLIENSFQKGIMRESVWIKGERRVFLSEEKDLTKKLILLLENDGLMRFCH